MRTKTFLDCTGAAPTHGRWEWSPPRTTPTTKACEGYAPLLVAFDSGVFVALQVTQWTGSALKSLMQVLVLYIAYIGTEQ